MYDVWNIDLYIRLKFMVNVGKYTEYDCKMAIFQDELGYEYVSTLNPISPLGFFNIYLHWVNICDICIICISKHTIYICLYICHGRIVFTDLHLIIKHAIHGIGK